MVGKGKNKSKNLKGAGKTRAAGRIKVVLLDIDDTLFNTREFAKRARMAALRAMRKQGMKAGEAKAYAALMQIVKEYGSNYSDHFGILLENVGEGRNSRMIAAGILAYHNTKQVIAPYADVKGAVAELKRMGLEVYAASEGRAIKQWDKLFRLGLVERLDGVFISEELGVEKGRAFYGKIARELRAKSGVRPGEILMVGDRAHKDYAPAREAGMEALLMVRPGKKAKGKVGAGHLVKSMQEVVKFVKVNR